MFVLASSMDSVSLWEDEEPTAINAVGSNSELHRNTAARGRRTGASHRYRFKTFVCSGSLRCLTSKTPGYGRAERNGKCGAPGNGDGGRPALRAVSHRHGRSNVWDVQMRLPEDGARKLEEYIVRI